jgi:hypothetical protein
MNCGAGRCHIQCEPGQGCGCIHVIDRDQCICECYEAEGGATRLNLSLANKIDICVSGLPLGRVATILDGVVARDVLVPAARTKQKIRLRMEGVRVSEALKALGLSTQQPARTGAAPPGGPSARRR